MNASPFTDPKHWFLALLIMLTAIPAAAQQEADAVGKVVVARGDVSARSTDNGSRSLERRSSIYQGETIITGESGRIQIRFEDGAVVALDSASELVIENYRFEEENADDHAVVKLLTGGLRTLSGEIAEKKPDNYEVKTPLASIGVRGTNYQLALTDEALEVAVWSGRVIVSNEAGVLPLGSNANYRFARVTARGIPPEGRLKPPESLGQSVAPDAADTSNADGFQGDDSVSEPSTLTESDAVEGQLETNLTGSVEQISEAPTENEEISESPESLLPEDGLQQFTLGASSALTEIDGVNAGDPTGPVFSAGSNDLDPETQQYVANRSGIAPIISLEGAGLDRFEKNVSGLGVNWGAWNGQPDLLLHEDEFDIEGEPLSPISQPLFLASGPVINSLDLQDLRGNNATLNFDTVGGSIGQIRDQTTELAANFGDTNVEVSGLAEINLGTGDVSGSIEVFETTQELLWSADLVFDSFDEGTISFNTIASNLSFNGNSESEGRITGMVVHEETDNQLGFLSSFKFETNDGSASTSGILLLEEAP